jgi:hypothetical protein
VTRRLALLLGGPYAGVEVDLSGDLAGRPALNKAAMVAQAIEDDLIRREDVR